MLEGKKILIDKMDLHNKSLQIEMRCWRKAVGRDRVGLSTSREKVA